MTEIVVLRNKPELRIILNNDEFEIVDASEPKNNGIYSFGELKNVELNAERTNWLISILSVITDFITGIGNGARFKDKSNLNIEMENRNLKLWLINADFGKAEKLTELIKSKKTIHNTVYN
ncbi:hypothetical protein GCM10011531_04110 [Aquaticitalea lipolytica]|uniref:Uncharacterized protein n=1 Tax=Aquaticitalea lipolytica TaxID=1247562 RepID=A0A8J2TP35_9FLAO|nr:hypothetical protein [Aquaticitalea lipolytica]GFZ77835.1 hypothetical protein GCM10011531_04110 [Aquaticitalea lipolytica]